MIIRSFLYWVILLGFFQFGYHPLRCCQATECLVLSDEEVQPTLTISHKRPHLSSACLDDIYQQLKSRNTLSEEQFAQRCLDQNNLDFTELDFQGLDLSTYDLRYTDFSGCKMRCINFYGALLCHAKFEDADLSKADCRKCDLTDADFMKAILNGACFKGAKLLGVNVREVRSSKGTLFADSKELTSKLTHEQEIKSHITELSGNPLSITLNGSLRLSAIHQTLFDDLCKLQRQGYSHTLVDFRNLEAIADQSAKPPKKLTSFGLYQLIHEFADILRSPYFKGLVERIDPQYDNSIILVQIKLPSLSLEDRIKKNSLKIPKLDLHGNIPLKIKYQWVEKFIKSFYVRGYPFVEIVTGRGLHNPKGKLGVLWTIFKSILRSEKFKPYVDDIHSIGENGGWKVDLKNPNKKIINRKGNSIKLTKDQRISKRNKEYLKDYKKEKFLRRETLRDLKYKYIMNLHQQKATPKYRKGKKGAVSKKKMLPKPSTSVKRVAVLPALGVVEVAPPALVKANLPKVAEKSKSSKKKKKNKAAKQKSIAKESSSTIPNARGLPTVSSASVSASASEKHISSKAVENLATHMKPRGKNGQQRVAWNNPPPSIYMDRSVLQELK